MTRSIRWRLSTYQVIVVSLAMVAVAVAGESSIRRYYLSRLETQLAQQAALIRRTLLPELGENMTRARVNGALRTLGLDLKVRVTIIAPSGDVLGDTRYAPGEVGNLAARPEVAVIAQGHLPPPQRYSRAIRDDGVHVAVPVTRYGHLVAIIRVSLSLDDLEEQLYGLRMVLLGTVLIATIVAVATTLYVTRSITEPIQDVADAAQRMAGGDLTPRVVSSPYDEVGRLTSSFNTMAARIQEMMGELDRERQKMARVFTEMTDGLVLLDADSRVVMMNPAAERMLGTPLAAAERKTLADIARFPELAEHAQSVLEHGEVIESSIVREGPDALVIHVNGAPVAERTGIRPGAMLVLQDWTEVWQTERLRREFVANASHELRTPIASVRMMAETLLEGAQDDANVRTHFLQLMSREANRLSELAADLLDLSQMEGGEWPMDVLSFPLRDAVEQVLSKLVTAAHDRLQDLSGKCPPDVVVLADVRALGHILTNLVENAVKYTPRGGEIRVSADATDDGRVRIRVQDSGIGIPPADLGHVFERFYRVDKARSREQGGSGLGLAIVRHLVDAMDGSIEVESVLGEGSTFTVYLPAGQLDEEQPAGGETRNEGAEVEDQK